MLIFCSLVPISVDCGMLSHRVRARAFAETRKLFHIIGAHIGTIFLVYCAHRERNRERQRQRDTERVSESEKENTCKTHEYITRITHYAAEMCVFFFTPIFTFGHFIENQVKQHTRKGVIDDDQSNESLGIMDIFFLFVFLVSLTSEIHQIEEAQDEIKNHKIISITTRKKATKSANNNNNENPAQ